MVATLPRSGSTYFAIQMWRTGLLGAPMEYLNFAIMAPLMRRLRAESNYLDYWERVKNIRHSPNGLFGYKMFMSNYSIISSSYQELLPQISPRSVIYLTRKDIVAQAVSTSRAIRSKTWFAGIRPASEVDYDYDHIAQCEKIIRSQWAFWESLFKLTNVQPLRVFYEDLLDDLEGTVQLVAEYLQTCLLPEFRLEIPIIAKQRDDKSRMWCERYRRDSAHLQAERGTALHSLSGSAGATSITQLSLPCRDRIAFRNFDDGRG